MTVTTRDYQVNVDRIGRVPLTVSERGEGRPFLLLHGGGGPATVAGFADLLAQSRQARVIAPTHPGFAGTPRPDALTTSRDLAALYTAFLDQSELDDVTVIGNSIGGWIAAEMGLLGSKRLSSVVLVDAVGIDVPDHPVVDFFALSLAEVAEHSYHQPEKFRLDPATMPAAQREAMAGNRATLAVYGGTRSMVDPSLRDRLRDSGLPTLVLWGESDRIVDPEYGRAFADAIPTARFQLLPATGHLPQIETPEELLPVIWEFADSHATLRPGR